MAVYYCTDIAAVSDRHRTSDYKFIEFYYLNGVKEDEEKETDKIQIMVYDFMG